MKNSGTKLGQNFLVDEAACLRIAAAAGQSPQQNLHRDSGQAPQQDPHRTVIEIGPGHGAITAPLAARCSRLHCIEFDPALARELTFRFRNDPHVTVHHADILKTDLRPFAAEANGPLDVVGNLPYYITSDILLHLFRFAREGLLRRAVLMMQREVAVRLASPAGASEYGPLSALAQLHGTVTELFTLPPGAFNPPPEVYSTVIRLDFAPRFAELGLEFESFNPFLRSTFAQKRKTLANNLRTAGFTAAQLAAAWPGHLAAQVRSEAVSLEDLATLYRALTATAAEPGNKLQADT